MNYKAMQWSEEVYIFKLYEERKVVINLHVYDRGVKLNQERTVFYDLYATNEFTPLPHIVH